MAAAIAALLLGSGLTASSRGDLSSRIAAQRSAAAALRSQVAADSRQIAGTADGVARARRRLAAIELTLGARTRRLADVQESLIAARDRLVDLENRMRAATTALSANLVAGYENGQPSLVSVVIQSSGFSQLLEQLGFMARVSDHNAGILASARITREQVAAQAVALAGLESRDRALAKEVIAQRNQAAALQSALLHRELAEVAHRAGVASQLSSVRARISSLQSQLDAIEKRAAEQALQGATGNAQVGGIAVDTGGMVQPPPGAPLAVREIIAAGNAIATLPYIYGGGHASFHADGYDCSGSVSYALAAGGLLSAPETSGELESWGVPGPGRYITVYANAGHTYMYVDGILYDTAGRSGVYSSRWQVSPVDNSGYVVRHWPGL
ncbi:MAG: hypothetical protein ACRDMX_09510 [Solirubrobacteraceae bacterium]